MFVLVQVFIAASLHLVRSRAKEEMMHAAGCEDRTLVSELLEAARAGGTFLGGVLRALRRCPWREFSRGLDVLSR